jgi:nitrogen fixation protein FixH
MKLNLKWNWGTGIVLAYTVFIVLIVTAVGKALNQSVDLVTPDYYAQELDYQNKYDKMANAGTLKEPVTVEQAGTDVVLTFPKDITGPLTGTVLFYRPSNSAEDVSMPISIGQDGKMVVPTAKLKKGNYSVLVDWKAGATKYFNKLILFVQ